MKVKLASDWFGPGGVRYRKDPDGGFTEIPASIIDKLPKTARIAKPGERPVLDRELPLDTRPRRGDGDPNVNPVEDLKKLEKAEQKGDDLDEIDPERKSAKDLADLVAAAEKRVAKK